MLLTKIGLTLIESLVKHSGDKQLLNNLDHGLLILDSTTKQKLFSNQALIKSQAEGDSINNSGFIFQDYQLNGLLTDDKLFARLDLELFN